MKLAEIINNCVYGTVGYISSQEDINNVEIRIIYNKPILSRFKEIIVVTNYKDISIHLEYEKMWKKHFDNVFFIHSTTNRGHSFGTADLDNALFDFCKQNNLKWLCKSDNDSVFSTEILDIEVIEADFYYINGIGFGGLKNYNFDFGKILQEDFYPQTYFYIINVDKTDFLTDKKFIDDTYNLVKNIPDYNGKVWEYIEGWSCENLLKQCVERNNLTKHHLLDLSTYFSLIN